MTVSNWVDSVSDAKPNPGVLSLIGQIKKSHSFIVGFAGRFELYKFFITYTQTAALLASSDVGFVFMGDGPLVGELEKVMGENSSIHYLGRLDNTTFRHVLKMCNLMLSSADETYLSLVAMESLSEGTPIMCVNRSGATRKYGAGVRVDESLIPAGTGFFVPDDPVAIAGIIQKLAAEGFPSEDTRQVCRRVARERYSLDNIKRILDLILG